MTAIPHQTQAVATGRHDGLPLELRIWPDPGCWKYHADGTKEDTHRTDIDLSGASAALWADYGFVPTPWTPPLDGLAAELPPRVRQVVSGIDTMVQLRALRLLWTVPSAVELPPSLLSMLAVRFAARRPFEDLGPLLTRRRVRLLREAQLPEEPWIVRLFNRLDGTDICDSRWARLSRTLRSPTKAQRRLLQHTPVLSGHALDVVCTPDYAEMVTPSLLTEVSARNRSAVRDAVRWEEDDSDPILGPLGTLRRVRGGTPEAKWQGPYRSLDAVRAAVLRLDIRDRSAFTEWDPSDYGAFPAPPFGEVVVSGDPPVRLRPLTSALELLEHGRAAKNCVRRDRTYPGTSERGWGYLYEVTWPADERTKLGTLAVHILEQGWQVDQLRGGGNAAVPEAVAVAVDQLVLGRASRSDAGLSRETVEELPDAPALSTPNIEAGSKR